MNDDKTPFSKAYVLKTTTRHMRRSIDISIRKSFDRMSDFSDNSKKRMEIMETLDVLHKMRKILDEFQENNQHLFTDIENIGEDNA
jgi:hypothetical protein